MTIMDAIEFWYMEIRDNTGNYYNDWVMDEVEKGEGCLVVLGFFCLEDVEAFE